MFWAAEPTTIVALPSDPDPWPTDMPAGWNWDSNPGHYAIKLLGSDFPATSTVPGWLIGCPDVEAGGTCPRSVYAACGVPFIGGAPEAIALCSAECRSAAAAHPECGLEPSCADSTMAP